MTPKRMFLIDAMALAFRSYHAFSKRPLTTAAGLPSSAIFGCASFLLKLCEDEKPDYLVIATDTREKTFRHELFPRYKANRSEMPADLAAQIPYIYELFAAFGCQVLRVPGVEADDVIGTLTTQFSSPDLHCFIVSGDKDFLQLVNEHTFLYSPKKGGLVDIVGKTEAPQRFGVGADQIRDMLAIMGDDSDNVPGVPGIGEKGAAKLLATFGSLEEIYANIDRVVDAKARRALESNRELAFLSQHLVTIRKDVPVDLTLDAIAFDAVKLRTSEHLRTFFHTWEFSSLSSKLTKADVIVGGSALDAAASPSSCDTRNYVTVRNRPALMSLIDQLKNASEFAFDTETTGLNVNSDTPIGMSFSTTEGSAFYVPLLSKHLDDDLNAQIILEQFRPLFADPTKLKIAHNLKFDMQMLRNLNMELASPCGDSMLAAFLLDPAKRTYGIDALSLEEFSFTKIPTSQLIGKGKAASMVDVDLDQLSFYACEDADFCLRLHRRYFPLLKERNLLGLYFELELPLVQVLAQMEQEGVHIDVPVLAELSELFSKRGAELEGEIHQIAGHPFNINSPKQMQEVLYVELKIPEQVGVRNIKKKKTGFSTDESVLEMLSDHPLPAKILEYRKVMKLKNTYTDTLPRQIDPMTHRVHSSFHQTGTATGRLSSSNPNLQNIPIKSTFGRQIRGAFTAPPGKMIVSADYSQIELRILAHMSGDATLLRAFANGEDIHRMTAATLLGVAPDQVRPEQRAQAKAINFGIIYGMGPQRLAKTTGMKMHEARDFIARYFASFASIKEFTEQTIQLAAEKGYCETFLGRRRFITGFAQGGMALAAAKNIAINTPIQGGAADLMKLAMLGIDKACRERQLGAKMLLQVHDELVFECSVDAVARFVPLVKSGMENAMALTVPLVAQIGYGKSWLEAHT